jgi:hypothetical protein
VACNGGGVVVRVILKAIVPNDLLKMPKVQAELKTALATTGKRLKRELLRPTATWRGKPTFDVDVQQDRVLVTTDKDTYVWTDLGTREHPIEARRAPFLVFRHPYGAKTRPGSLSARGATYGNKWARVKRVPRHPGTKARGFSTRVAMLDQRAGRFQKDVQDAINRGIKP